MIGIVIPALNESPTVGEVVRETLATIPDAVVVVVDDASDDGTDRIAREAGAIVVVHRESKGYAEALRAGYAAVIEQGAERILQLDADGQHSAGDLPALLDGLERYDLVIGSRFKGAGFPMSKARRIGIAACQAMVRVCGLNVSDPTSGIRAMRLSVAKPLVQFGYPDGLTESSFLVWLLRRGLTIGEVPVTMSPADSASMHDGFAGVIHFGKIVRSTASVALRRRAK